MKDLWIYAFTRQLNPLELKKVSNLLKDFVLSWKVHGKAARGSFFYLYNQFFFLHNPHSLSGCSIDSSTSIFKTLKEADNLDGLSSANKLFYRNQNKEIVWFEKYLLASKLKKKELDSNTIIFNNQITTLKSYENKEWEIALKDSWIFSKYKDLLHSV